MNPIPLSHRRRVYAWACGRCGRVGYAGEFVGYDPDPNKLCEAIATIARGSREDAERCCRCMECGVGLPVGEHSGHCAACEGKRLAIRQEAEKAALQLHEAMEAYARDYYDAFSDGERWPVSMAFDLWRDASAGGHPVTDNLAALSRQAGGWWHRRDGESEPGFFPTDEWTEMVSEATR